MKRAKHSTIYDINWLSVVAFCPHQPDANYSISDYDNGDPACYGIVSAGFDFLFRLKPEAWTAVASLAIAAFTGTLWRSTHKLWAVTKISADALPTIERAYLFIDVDEIKFGRNASWAFQLMKQQGKPARAEFEIEIENHGKTPAEIIAVKSRCCWSRWVPDRPPYESSGPHILKETACGPPRQLNVMSEEPTATMVSSIVTEQIPLWLYGVVVYEDVTGKVRETFFCWRWMKIVGYFARWGGKEYNYRT